MKYGLVKLRAELLLILTAMIWGSTFVVQKTAMSNISPFMFNTLRSLIGAGALFVINLFFHSERDKKLKRKNKDLYKAGIVAGFLLYFGMAFQQWGLTTSSAGHAGFISSLYILLVPLIALLFGKRVRKEIWFCIFVALIGLYLLCVNSGNYVSKGDILVFFSTFFFAFHIIWISKYAGKVNAIKLSCIQFLTAGIFSFFTSVNLEVTTKSGIIKSIPELLVAGVLSSAVAYTLQIIAQKHIKPYIASLILSLESVFSVIAGYIFLHEILSLKEIIGCILVFISIFMTEYGKKNK